MNIADFLTISPADANFSVEFLLASAAVFFLISVMKGAFGGGFGLLVIPVMTLLEVVLHFRPVSSQFKMDHGFIQAANLTGSTFLS